MKNKKTNFVMLMLSSALIFTSCGNANKQKEDDASNEVASIKIGTQEWTSKNLDVATFRNGDSIPQVKTDEEWETAGSEGKPAWCYYNNDPENGKKYGKLYNRYAVMDARGLAPSGWHIPTGEDNAKLIEFLGGKKVAGDKLKSIEGWKEDKNGTNETGFNGLPGGYRDFRAFYSIGESAMWWTTSNYNETLASNFWLRYKGFPDNINTSYNEHTFGGYVRCIKD